MKIAIQGPVFDYRTLRLIMGSIALLLPVIVSRLFSSEISSISASYHTEMRDWFVGPLFIVGALLWAYNGHQTKESIASKVAALAVICVAIFPTSSGQSETSIISSIHYISAVVLFTILAWFCFFPFQKKTKGNSGKKGVRSNIYLCCGGVMVACMLSVLAAKLIIPQEFLETVPIVFWAETFALFAFGVAWFVASKWGWLADPEERLKLFG